MQHKITDRFILRSVCTDEAAFGSEGVGSKANNILIKVRGKDFTKEKNKKKRSTYMCGAITMASNSFKFD